MTRLTFGFGYGERSNGSKIPVITARVRLGKITREAARLFGGYSVIRIRGGWINGDGRLVREPGIVLEVVSERRLGELLPIARAFRETIKEVLEQEAIVLTAQTLDLVESR